MSLCLTAKTQMRSDAETETLIPITGAVFDVAHALRAEGFDASEDGTGRGTPIVPVQQPIVLMERGRSGESNLEFRQDGTANAILTPNGGRGGFGVGAIAFDETQITSVANYSNPQPGDPCHPLASGARPPAIAFSSKDYGNDAMTDLSPTLRSMGHDGSHANGDGQVAIAIQAGATRENPASGPDGVGVQEDHAYTLEARAEVQAVAFAQNQRDELREMNVAGALATEPGMKQQTYLAETWAVRRLTPTECERLQGFPDGWTSITYRGKPAADGPRYKAIGNSMACNVMRWIGMRIDWADRAATESAAA